MVTLEEQGEHGKQQGRKKGPCEHGGSPRDGAMGVCASTTEVSKQGLAASRGVS